MAASADEDMGDKPPEPGDLQAGYVNQELRIKLLGDVLGEVLRDAGTDRMGCIGDTGRSKLPPSCHVSCQWRRLAYDLPKNR
jgi:hypothetical protein